MAREVRSIRFRVLCLAVRQFDFIGSLVQSLRQRGCCLRFG
jgi:hypothetical protein